MAYLGLFSPFLLKVFKVMEHINTSSSELHKLMNFFVKEMLS